MKFLRGAILALVVIFAAACASEGEVSELNELLNRPDVVVVDVRTAEEFAQGHIVGALLVPADTITQEVMLAQGIDFEQTVVVYCRSGARSQAAAAALREMGFAAVVDIGGMLDWQNEVNWSD